MTTLDIRGGQWYTENTYGRDEYVYPCPIRKVRSAAGVLFAALSSCTVAIMDAYDQAAEAVEERRARAVAEVLALHYAQELRWRRRVAEGLGCICEDCGGVIDAKRRAEYPPATVCRACARGERE